MYNLEVSRVGQIFSTLYYSNFGVEIIILSDRIDFVLVLHNLWCIFIRFHPISKFGTFKLTCELLQ